MSTTQPRTATPIPWTRKGKRENMLPLTQRFKIEPVTPEEERRAMLHVAASVPREDVKLVLQRLGLVAW